MSAGRPFGYSVGMRTRRCSRSTSRLLALAALGIASLVASADPAAGAAASPDPAPRATPQPLDFDALFTGATLRIDLLHAGDRSEESFSLAALRAQGPWAGPRARLLDETNFGGHLLKMYDPATDRLVFSRGFSSFFDEWRTTDEAKAASRSMPETLLAPMPRGRARIVIASRDRDNRFRDVFAADVDPTSGAVVREDRCSPEGLIDVAVTGPPPETLDILILADGYAAAEKEKFRRDAARFARKILATPPFTAHRDRINVRALWTPSADSGADEPRKGIDRRNVVGSTFNTFGLERYMTVPDPTALHDLAACAPMDRALVLVNTARYGGAGIHDAWAVSASDNEYGDYVAVHEFAHAFAGLGDEYYVSTVSFNEFYPSDVEPWEANITALLPGGRPKWADLLTPGVPVPTPPDPARYGSVVGAFEGAGYAAKGLYRPALDCMMYSKGYAPFDPVCSRAIEQVILHYAGAP